MPVLIAMGNGFLKMVDDGKSPDKPSNFQLVPLDSAPPEVKNVLMEELRSLAEAPPTGPAAMAGPDMGMPPQKMGMEPSVGKTMAPSPAKMAKEPTPPAGPGGLPPELMSAMPGNGPMGMPPEMPMGPEPSVGYQRRGY